MTESARRAARERLRWRCSRPRPGRRASIRSGVECFEGVVTDRSSVDELLERVRRLAVEGAERGLFAAERPLVTAGGSIFFDAAAGLAGTPGADVVLRSGCYVTHDDGLYEAASPLARSACRGRPAAARARAVDRRALLPRARAGDRGRRPERRALRRRPPVVLRAYRGGEALPLGARDGHRAQRPARVRRRRRAAARRPAVPRHLAPVRRVRPLADACSRSTRTTRSRARSARSSEKVRRVAPLTAMAREMAEQPALTAALLERRHELARASPRSRRGRSPASS